MSDFICTVCNLRGKHHIFNVNHDHRPRQSVEELRRLSEAYRNAQTLSERKKILQTHGVRWSSFWLLEYWDPTQMLVINAMHCILEGVVHYHCCHTVSKDLKIPEQQVVSVVKVQKALSLAISGDKALTLEQLWTRLDNQGTLGSLQFVAHTLGLPMTLDSLSSKVSMIHVQRACRASKKPGLVRAPTGLPTTKSHYIALLVDWRLLQPHSSTAFIIPTGTPEPLSHIQQVIRYATTASWLNSVPKNYGEANAGSIKADKWRILSTVYLPIALITLWGDDDGRAPPSDSFLMKALDHTMALFQATIIACKYTMTSSRPMEATIVRTLVRTLSDAEDIIDLDDIIAHAARYDYSHNRSVMLNLSRQ
ncbi:hypothetical protein BT96DRAFT_1066689 [Gymnopus androsaceus JB14]|uniref:Uncharacterized protein n=1 Tax=Gymnopus androsaceus JB14 TaxID=1447944 RepID=A0A6A4GVG3_9AGAR|nr:hypothetical protein BT96DRAFT_1066689 [Gymnopus androsaceus JB14]